MPALRSLCLLLLVSLGAAPARAQDYGETDFPNSGAPEAQGAFLRGLLMLHSFEYEDAREAFQEARRLDPTFAMAYWGEAMTHNHPIWQEQDRDAALEALGRLAPTPEERYAKAPTDREKDYLWTLDVLFGEGSKEARDFAYADALAELANAYPDDLDAAAFYALAILGTAHDGRDFATYMQAAAVAEEVFAANPRHPGAAHYLIHAYDDPVHAPLGLRPARVYDAIAPAASHALHMPSHIYFALGMWDDGAAMNVRSFEAAKARTDAHGEPLNGHGWHALLWLQYAELQRARHAEAARLLALAEALAEENPRRAALPLLMRAQHLAVTEDWDGATARSEPALPNGGLETAAQALFTYGWAALERGERATAEAALADLLRRVEGEDAPPGSAQVALLQLDALLALADGDEDDALDLLQEAAAVEDAMPLDFGPAVPVKPAHELLGDVLLRLGRPELAMGHYEDALARYPRRSRALLGLARAAAAADDPDTAQRVYAELAEIWRDADADSAALAEVRLHAGAP